MNPSRSSKPVSFTRPCPSRCGMAAAAQRNDKESLHGTNGADWDDTNEKKFLQWCAVRDIQAPNVRIAQFGRDLRGVAAQSSIEPGACDQDHKLSYMWIHWSADLLNCALKGKVT